MSVGNGGPYLQFFLRIIGFIECDAHLYFNCVDVCVVLDGRCTVDGNLDVTTVSQVMYTALSMA